MTADLPSDVATVLAQLFEACREAFRSGDIETALATIGSAETVIVNKLPAGPLRERLRHGCEQVKTTEAAADSNVAVATEYVTAMERRLSTARAE